MNIKEQLELDIKRFFQQIESQNNNDKVETLRILFDKYIHLSQADFIMEYHDLRNIIECSKGKFASKTFPAYIGDKKTRVMESEQVSLCLIESVVSHLNKNDCLKKIPKFNYKENKF